jgi:hypothetical protein
MVFVSPSLASYPFKGPGTSEQLGLQHLVIPRDGHFELYLALLK